MINLQPFHLAMPVNDLQSTRKFYGKTLGMSEGRSSDDWIDWNLMDGDTVELI